METTQTIELIKDDEGQTDNAWASTLEDTDNATIEGWVDTMIDCGRYRRMACFDAILVNCPFGHPMALVHMN
jgi:hypothetical protein